MSSPDIDQKAFSSLPLHTQQSIARILDFFIESDKIVEENLRIRYVRMREEIEQKCKPKPLGAPPNTDKK